MSHIFISYNQADADFAAILSIHIEKAGIDTWMDKNRLRPGQDWSIEIDDGIQSAHALVVVMSPEAKASEYVTYEWSFALGAGIPVIPVLYRDTTLHPRLARLHYLKFTDTTVRPWEDLIETIKEAVSESGVHVVRVPRNAPPHVKSAVLALDSANEADRSGAISVLAQTDHPSGKEALVAALRHPIQDVRWQAAQNLPHEPQTIPVLLEILRRGDWNVRRSYDFASLRLPRLGEPGKAALFDALVDPEINIWRIDEALVKVPSDEIVPRLLTLLKDPDPTKRMRAACVLRHWKLPEISQALFDALRDPDEQVRKSIIEAFQKDDYQDIDVEEETFIHTEEALMQGIQDVSGVVRMSAVSGFKKCVPCLTGRS